MTDPTVYGGEKKRPFLCQIPDSTATLIGRGGKKQRDS